MGLSKKGSLDGGRRGAACAAFHAPRLMGRSRHARRRAHSPSAASTPRAFPAACGIARAFDQRPALRLPARRSEEHTSELQSLMRISYAVFCLKQKKKNKTNDNNQRYSEK